MCSNCVQNREHVEFVAEQMNTSERVRENYREQGRCQERQRIIEQVVAYVDNNESQGLDQRLREAIDAESNDSLAKGCEWGAKDERNRIIKVLENQPFIWMGEKQLLQISKDALIALIRGEN